MRALVSDVLADLVDADVTAVGTAADATAQQIPLVAAPREQRAALVAITQSVQLTCDAPRVDAVRDFAVPYYAGLAL